MSDRSGEWFRHDMFEDVISSQGHRSVIVRKALATRAMLRAMTDLSNSETTSSFTIENGELIVGVIPLGSLGLGKVFPDYLTEEEWRVASVTNRGEMSVFGHNSVDYKPLCEKGLKSIIQLCHDKIADQTLSQPFRDFYEACGICCEAVCEYAEKFAELADAEARTEKDEKRKRELTGMAEICRKVPAEPAETFQEALQSIFFVHLALHSSMNFLSLGRLDQVLQPYYEKSMSDGMSRDELLDVFQCFLVKCAGRLNMNPAYLLKQDHMSYAVALGTNPVYLDQWSSANNFLQNIVIGGVRPDGTDASNDCTYLILDAYKGFRLSTPNLNIRMHLETPAELLEEVARTVSLNKNGFPVIVNDAAVIPALLTAGIDAVDANDFVLDGCWEPILNGKCDWTFRMINMLSILECSLNGGAMLSADNLALRGAKVSHDSPLCHELNTFEKLLNAVGIHTRYFMDQAILGMYEMYAIDESITPTPLQSALLHGCLEKGKDKSWGGAEKILGGVVAAAVPDIVDTLVAIERWVYRERKFSLQDVADAFRYSYRVQDHHPDKEFRQTLYDEIKIRFMKDSPKFGNGEASTDVIMRKITDLLCDTLVQSVKLAEKVFLNEPTEEEMLKIQSLRRLTGYDGRSMKEEFGSEFKIHFSVGMGTFECYNVFGMGNAASADRVQSGEGLSPNFSPKPGFMNRGLGHLFSSFESIGLNRFGAGVITDVTVEETDLNPNPQSRIKQLTGIIDGFLKSRGSIMSLSIASSEQLGKIFDLCRCAEQGDEVAAEALKEYSNVVVRVGGSQAAFITLPEAHQKSHMQRPVF